MKILQIQDKQSLNLYKELARITDKPCSFEQKGLFMVAQSDDGYRYAKTEMELVARHGIPGRIMGEEEARAFEGVLGAREHRHPLEQPGLVAFRHEHLDRTLGAHLR